MDLNDLDRKIAEKQAEIKELAKKRQAAPIVHERNPGEPLIIHSANDLIRHSILRKEEEIAELEYDTLLHQRYQSQMPIDLEVVEKRISDLRSQIAADHKELGE